MRRAACTGAATGAMAGTATGARGEPAGFRCAGLFVVYRERLEGAGPKVPLVVLQVRDSQVGSWWLQVGMVSHPGWGGPWERMERLGSDGSDNAKKRYNLPHPRVQQTTRRREEHSQRRRAIIKIFFVHSCTGRAAARAMVVHKTWGKARPSLRTVCNFEHISKTPNAKLTVRHRTDHHLAGPRAKSARSVSRPDAAVAVSSAPVASKYLAGRECVAGAWWARAPLCCVALGHASSATGSG